MTAVVPPVFSGDRRGVSPVIGVGLTLAITVFLATAVGSAVIGAGGHEPTPTVARSTGEFVTGPSNGCGDNIVRIRHAGGDPVPSDEIEIAVQLLDTDSQARITDLPVSGTALSPANVDDPNNVVYDYCVGGVIADGGQPWTAGRVIVLQLNAGGGTITPGDTVTVRVVHTPSNGVLAAVELTARR